MLFCACRQIQIAAGNFFRSSTNGVGSLLDLADDFGESLVAAVEPMTGVELTARHVQDYLQARLAKYKVPRRVEFHKALPREDSGKIFKRRLRDPFWQKAGRRI